MDTKRHFTIVEIQINGKKVAVTADGGRYSSTKPHSAARKAGARALRQSKASSAHVTIRETTQGSNKKIYKYKVDKKKTSAKKQKLKFEGMKKPIIAKWEYAVHKA